MDFTQKDLMNLSNRDYILGNTTVEEQVEFISEQIAQPFDSGSTNYFKKLKTMTTNQDQMDEICGELFRQIENVYPSLEFDVDGYGKHLTPAFNSVYKFFIRNINKLMYIFIREYIFNNKNRKGLVAEHLNTKMPSYPKEQYGKKEFYVLITKLPAILSSIRDDDIQLTKFINYIDRSDEAPLYLEDIRALIDQGFIIDNGVVTDMFGLMDDSDARPGIMNKLEMIITSSLIHPYLKENNMLDIGIVPTVDPDDDIDDSDDESDD